MGFLGTEVHMKLEIHEKGDWFIKPTKQKPWQTRQQQVGQSPAGEFLGEFSPFLVGWTFLGRRERGILKQRLLCSCWAASLGAEPLPLLLLCSIFWQFPWQVWQVCGQLCPGLRDGERFLRRKGLHLFRRAVLSSAILITEQAPSPLHGMQKSPHSTIY